MKQSPHPKRSITAVAPPGQGESACQPKRWLFLCLAQIVNYTAVRRLLGRERAELLASDLIDRILPLRDGLRVSALDGRTVEIAFEDEDRSSIDRLLEELAAAFAAPFAVDGEHHQIEVALGGAAGTWPQTDGLRLLEEAEIALEKTGRSGVAIVRDAMIGNAAITHANGARELAAAIGHGQLRLQYQPKVHLRRQEVTSVEALIRWQHPEFGWILPGEFIPVAEDMHLIDELTIWTIRQVIADQSILRGHGYDPTIFINVSGQLLSDTRFVRQASALVRESNVNIGFEVTETSVIRDPRSAIANLNLFADAGITIAIDDYGAGLSSLAYLKELPARELKIDKLFVTQLATSNRDPLIVRSTIDLAHALEMEVVAEGVETASALALLTVMGCDMAQGFLISRPIGIDALIRFLDEERYRDIGEPHRFRLGQMAIGSRSGQ